MLCLGILLKLVLSGFGQKNLMQNLFCCNSNGFLLKSLYVLFLFFRTHKSFEPAKKKKLKNGWCIDEAQLRLGKIAACGEIENIGRQRIDGENFRCSFV